MALRRILLTINDVKMLEKTQTKVPLIKNGKWKEFNKHAILIAEGWYVNNEKHGLWKEYYDYTGSLMVEERYYHGLQHGRFRSYHPNGQVWSEGNFHYGSREGIFSVYDENGSIIRTMMFVNNAQVNDGSKSNVISQSIADNQLK
jgi:antitoxin component YwqK of YwqJK toxin-antitoxin module